MKRLFDILISLYLLIILSPLLIIVIIILRFSGEGEVFYRQERMGYGYKPFFITKFATMVKDSPSIGTGEITLQNDPRVLPMGKFLRKSKINEFPQFWDILIGNMSFVGPRPQTVKTAAMFPEKYQDVLKRTKPGITGIGSIVFRDEEDILSRAEDYDAVFKNKIIPFKATVEKWYVDNRSFWLDYKLCFITLWVIAFPKSKILQKAFPSLPVFEE